MSNYYSTARTNYFRIKNTHDFEEWVNTITGVTVIPGATNDIVTLLFEDSVPSFRMDEKTGEADELDFMLELSRHLADDEVAVVMEAGHEKMRYIVGFAEAINNQGRRVSLNLESIYKLAEQLGKNISKVEY